MEHQFEWATAFAWCYAAYGSFPRSTGLRMIGDVRIQIAVPTLAMRGMGTGKYATDCPSGIPGDPGQRGRLPVAEGSDKRSTRKRNEAEIAEGNSDRR